MDEQVSGDMEAWIVLSHLASIGADFGENSLSLGMMIFIAIGNSKELIYKPPQCKLDETPNFHFHTVPGVGSLLCASSGFIEPLLQAMYFHVLWRPEELKQLVNYAITENKIFPAWRLIMVLQIVKRSINIVTREAAFHADDALKSWGDENFDVVTFHHE